MFIVQIYASFVIRNHQSESHANRQPYWYYCALVYCGFLVDNFSGSIKRNYVAYVVSMRLIAYMYSITLDSLHVWNCDYGE